MYHFGCALLLSFVLISGCTANKPDNVVDGKKAATITVDSEGLKDSEEVLLPVAVTPPVVEDVVAPVVVLEPVPVPPVYNRGGSKNRPRLPCENGTSDCNDKNPCTVDTCNNDTCTHTLDESKDEFGSCEVDGHSCTVGKCIEDEGNIQCFEQRREYILGELGCQDNNQCTTDSCIEIPLKKEPKTTKDGDVIPNNQFQCVQEISSGLLCQARGCLTGFCEQVGTGMSPEDPFMVGCVVPQDTPIDCPDTGNPCTINTCVDEACVEQNVEAKTPCADDDLCTQNEQCDGFGACKGDAVNPLIACGESPEQCRAYACDSNLGCVLTGTADEGLACRSGDPCLVDEVCTGGVCGNGATVLCPTDGNVCTSDTCRSGLGCIYEPITDDPPACSDNNNCTVDDACSDGVCVGAVRDCSVDPANPCQVGFCDMSNENGCTTIDFTGPYGADCTTPYPGICADGKFMCLEGQLTAMCEPLVRPGDKAITSCFDPTKDNDCDGKPDSACNCPLPPETTIYRYVDPAGSDTANNCINANAPCKTITHAIAQAVAGDTLLLSSGTFNEHDIVVAKNLYIYGQGAGVSIVDAKRLGRVFAVSYDINVSICGLTMMNGNNGIYSDGNLTITSSTISNSVNSGIDAGLGVLTINNSTVSGNTAFNGGGIDTSAITTINNSTISGNRAFSAGAGILTRSGTLTINNSTFSGNTAFNGGGIYALIGTSAVTINNSTFSGNSASTAGGGIYTGSTTMISNSTITNNSAPNGAGLYRAGGTATIDHTIIAAQSSGADCFGTIIDNGYNLDSDNTNSCVFSGTSKNITNFTLPALANNGGPTKTHALISGGAGNQAIDAGNTTCGVTTDQRGEPRPVNYTPLSQAHCDIGAFELQLP